jgi:hypothetical protein
MGDRSLVQVGGFQCETYRGTSKGPKLEPSAQPRSETKDRNMPRITGLILFAAKSALAGLASLQLGEAASIVLPLLKERFARPGPASCIYAWGGLRAIVIERT